MIYIILSLILLFIYEENRINSIERIIKSWLKLSLFILVSTEVISLFRGINSVVFHFVWLIFIAYLIWHIYTSIEFDLVDKILKELVSKLLLYKYQLLFLIGPLFIAILSDINNIDVNQYHLPRVRFWMNAESIIATNNGDLRLDIMPPLSEYFMLHKIVLSGSDQFLGLINLVSLLVILTTTVGITSLFKNEYKTKSIVLWFVLLIPILIVVSGIEKSHMTVVSYVIIVVYYSLKYHNSNEIEDLVIIVTASVLSILSKSTSIIFICFPIIVTVSNFFSLKRSFIHFKRLSILLMFSLIILSPFLYRNYIAIAGRDSSNLFGTPVANYSFTISGTYSNILRLLGNNSWTTINFVNRINYDLILKAHEIFNLDINDTRYTWEPEIIHFKLKSLTTHEDSAENGVQLVLIIISFCLIFYDMIKKEQDAKLQLLNVFTFLTLFLFCLLVRWQPWHNRLIIPLFIVNAIYFGVRFSDKKIFSKLVLVILFVQAIPFYFSSNRPLISKSQFDLTHAHPNVPGSQSKSLFTLPFELNYHFSDEVDKALRDSTFDQKLTINDLMNYSTWRILDTKYGFNNYHVIKKTDNQILIDKNN